MRSKLIHVCSRWVGTPHRCMVLSRTSEGMRSAWHHKLLVGLVWLLQFRTPTVEPRQHASRDWLCACLESLDTDHSMCTDVNDCLGTLHVCSCIRYHPHQGGSFNSSTVLDKPPPTLPPTLGDEAFPRPRTHKHTRIHSLVEKIRHSARILDGEQLPQAIAAAWLKVLDDHVLLVCCAVMRV
jgi:hypothetical protein